MLDTFLLQLEQALSAIKAHIFLTIYILASLWIIQLINAALSYKLNLLGIYPRKLRGLIGIPFFVFLHGSFNHLFFNSIPLFVLVDFMLIIAGAKFITATAIIIVLSGLATWLMGRKGVHIGASGLVMGYWGYLLVDAYRHPSVTTGILALIGVYYFSGLLLNLFPSEERVSWEGHVFGFLSGLVAVYIAS